MGLFGGKKKDDAGGAMPPPIPGGPMPPPNMQSSSQPMDMTAPTGPQPGAPMPQPMQQPPPMGPPQPMQQPPPMGQPIGEEPPLTMEETVEAIIDEKWNDLLKDITKIIDWKERTESTVNKLQQEVEDLRNGLDSLHKSIMSKISTYDQNIKNVGVDIKAMEQVFQRILPKFTDNVNKLSRITDKVSKK